MALPALMIPIILATAALGGGIVQGISAAKSAKNQAMALQESAQEQINERAKNAKKLMQQQKTSFLKSGIYFDSGTPVDVINETYNTSMDDINALAKDYNTKISNLVREGRTAFFSAIPKAIGDAAMSYFTAGSSDAAKTAIGASATKNSFKSWYQNFSGKYRGGFGSVNGTNDKIV